MITNISIASVFVKDIDESVTSTSTSSASADDDSPWATGIGGAPSHPSQPELPAPPTMPGPPFSPELVEAMTRAQADGGLNGLGIHVDDCRKTYEELAAKGVEFIQKPEERPYGVEALVPRQLRQLGGPRRAPRVLTRGLQLTSPEQVPAPPTLPACNCGGPCRRHCCWP